MKLAISSYSLSRVEPKWSLGKKIDWIAKSGADAIEFSGLQDEKPATVVKRCAKHKLPIVSYCIGAELCLPPKKQREAVDQLKREVDIAAELGVASMRHDVTRGFSQYRGRKGAQTFAACLKVVVPAIREVADYAAKKGVKTTLENHGFYMQDPRRVKKLLDTVDHPNFALTMDMGNFLCVDADPVEAVRLLAPYAVMVHAKDFHVRPKQTMPQAGWFATPKSIALRGAIVGHGVIDIPKQLGLLKRAGYDGCLSLEFEGMEEPTKAVALGLEYLRQQIDALDK